MDAIPAEDAKSKGPQMPRPLESSQQPHQWSARPVWWGCMLHTLGGGVGAIFGNWAKWDEYRDDVVPPILPDGRVWHRTDQAELEFVLFTLGLLVVYLTIPLWVPFQILTNLTARITVTEDALSLQTGILFKRQRSLPIAQIEAVDVQREFGGSAFVIVRASHGRKLELRRVTEYQELQTLQPPESETWA